MQLRHLYSVQPVLVLLFVLALLAPAMVLVPSAGAVPLQNVNAASGSGKIQIENLDRIPYNDRLVFQRINSNFSGPTHKTVTLRIKNVDTTPLTVSSLTISGGDSASFTIPSADRSGFILAAGEARNVIVSFVAGNAGTIRGLRQSTLFIQSSDALTPILPVQLAGYNMVSDGGVNEPILQEIADTFGYITNILNPNEGQTLRGKRVEGSDPAVYIQNSVGDEVYSARWAQADPSQPVYVRELAALSGSSNDAATVCVGSTCATHGPDQFQSFLPFQGVAGNLGAPTEITANPGSSFVIKAGNYGTDRAPERGRGVRLWTVRDRSGVLIPNTYIVGQDYVGSSATNYDYQDNAYVITNIRPVNQAIDPNRAAPSPGNSSLVLEFDRTYAGTLADKDGESTGFVDTQRNKNDITAPEVAPTSSYDNTKLDLNTGEGTLTIKTSAGSNNATDNALVNGLCLPFDGRAGRFMVSTRLIGPLDNLATAYQQAGVMFGPSQGNFVKITAGVQATGTAGKPWIQFVQELDNVPTQLGELASIPNPAAITSLDLMLTADAATGKIEAGYRINDGIPVTLPDSVTLTGTARARFFDLQTKGCVLALHKNATEINVAFDRFAITPAPAAVGLPQVNAGMDQQVPLGASVTLSGTAVDATGTTPLTNVNWEQVSGSRSVTLNGSGNSRTFTAPSSYSVLTFAFAGTDSEGRSASDTVTITVGDEPISGLTVTTNSPTELGSPTRFNASAANGSMPITYEWNFGDGSPVLTGGAAVKHTYAALGQYNVTLTARNAANSATIQTLVTVQRVVPAFTFRYNIGGPTVKTSGDSVTWTTDQNLFSPAAPSEKRPVAPEIANTDDDIIYHDYRGKVITLPKILTFEFPINSKIGLPENEGTRVLVDLRLHFAEIYWGGSQGVPDQSSAGKRIFDVFAEGSLILNNFDIAATAGGADIALVVPLDGVAVTDGKLTIALQAVKDYPSLAAIELVGSPKEPLENNSPSVNAGTDQTVNVGSQVTLTGSGSDPDSDELTYSWQQNSGPTVTLAGSGLVRTFTPTGAGSYIFTLTATDARGLQGADTIVITVNDSTLPPNNPPSANAGQDQTSLVGVAVVLVGSGSDPDDEALTYSWQQTDGPAVAVSGNDGDSIRSFTPTSVGSYIFTLTVTDARGVSGADSVVITITNTPPPNNQAPTANAGADQTVQIGTQVTLSGLASNDPDNNVLTYNWQQTGGLTVVLSANIAAQPTFVAPNQPTLLTFQLIVTDNSGASSVADEVQVTVTEGPVIPTNIRLFLPIVTRN